MIGARKVSVGCTAILLGLGWAWGPARAQATAPAGSAGDAGAAQTFTLDGAMAYALRNYPAVRAALEQVNAARANTSLARTQYLPSLSGVYQDSRATQNQVPGIWLGTAITPTVEGPVGGNSGQSFWASQTAALFSWEPADFGLRPAEMAQAKAGEDKASAGVAVTRLEVAAAAGSYFLNAAARQQAAVAAQSNVERWQVFQRAIHTLVDNELRPGADASRADAQLARARLELARAQEAERAAVATLAALLGAAGSPIALDAGRLLEPPAAVPPNILSNAVSNPASNPASNWTAADNPRAREQMSAVKQVQAQEKVLSKTDYPRIFLQGEAFARGSDIPNNGAPLNGATIGHADGLLPGRGNWVAGVTVTFPNVFDFKALSAEKQMAKANERSQQALYDQSIQDVTGRVESALAELEGARLVAEQTPLELAAAKASETQSRARYESSLATMVEVADSEGLLAEAEMDDAVARLNVWRGLFAVAYAQGNLQPFLDLLAAPASGAPRP